MTEIHTCKQFLHWHLSGFCIDHRVMVVSFCVGPCLMDIQTQTCSVVFVSQVEFVPLLQGNNLRGCFFGSTSYRRNESFYLSFAIGWRTRADRRKQQLKESLWRRKIHTEGQQMKTLMPRLKKTTQSLICQVDLSLSRHSPVLLSLFGSSFKNNFYSFTFTLHNDSK